MAWTVMGKSGYPKVEGDSRENRQLGDVLKGTLGGSWGPELAIKRRRIADLVTLDTDNSGTRRAAAFRESYLRLVEKHDGPSGRNLLKKHFRSHPLDDPFGFAIRMHENIVLGVYADSDGTLTTGRNGYNSHNLFGPRLATAINNTIGKTGLFTIASASHIKRALILLAKAKKQVPLERVLFFAENGFAAIVPVKTADGYAFEIHKAAMPEFVTDANLRIQNALDTLSEAALDLGLFMFVNHDKEAKVTLELKRNGKEVNRKITRKLVLPCLAKELRLSASAVRTDGEEQSLELPPLKYDLIPTWNSIEIDHNYLATKRTVNTILSDLVRLLWLHAFGNGDQIEGNRVFVGFGNSPRGSDAGLLDPLSGNIGFVVREQSRKLERSEKLLVAVRHDADPPYVTLPVFSEDCTIQYGDGDAVAGNLDRLFFTGTYFRIKDIEKMRACLREVLREVRYIPMPSLKREDHGGMYTVPSYLEERRDAQKLMKEFLSSDIADTDMDKKISAIASRVGIDTKAD